MPRRRCGCWRTAGGGPASSPDPAGTWPHAPRCRSAAPVDVATSSRAAPPRRHPPRPRSASPCSGARPLRRAVKPLAKPVTDGLPHGVSARGPDSRVQLFAQCLEPDADLLLGLAKDLPPATRNNSPNSPPTSSRCGTRPPSCWPTARSATASRRQPARRRPPAAPRAPAHPWGSSPKMSASSCPADRLARDVSRSDLFPLSR